MLGPCGQLTTHSTLKEDNAGHMSTIGNSNIRSLRNKKSKVIQKFGVLQSLQ